MSNIAESLNDITISDTAEVNYSYLPELLGYLLGIAHLRATELCTAMMEPLMLTPKQFVTLEFIANNPDVMQKDIAYHVGTSPAALVANLDHLTRLNLVCRVRSRHDRRRQSVRITKEGEALRAEIRRLAFEVEERFAAETGLEPEEREILIRILRKMTRRQAGSYQPVSSLK